MSLPLRELVLFETSWHSEWLILLGREVDSSTFVYSPGKPEVAFIQDGVDNPHQHTLWSFMSRGSAEVWLIQTSDENQI